MRIVIDYHSCWQASFLEGSDHEPLPKNNKREFNASSKSTAKKDVAITKDTVMGVLCRLIGDQRKLYQARQADHYFFNDIESSITFNPIVENQWKETVSIINKKETRPPQSNYIGVIKSDTGLFISEHAPVLWSVIFLDIDNLIAFINSNDLLNKRVTCNPTRILDRIFSIFEMEKIETRESIKESKQKELKKAEEKLKELEDKLAEIAEDNKLQKLKNQIERQGDYMNSLEKELDGICADQELADKDQVLQKTIGFLRKNFSQEYLEKDHKILPIRLYASALYLQLNRMKQYGTDVSNLINEREGVQGFSKRGFNGVRDFLNTFSSSMVNKKTINTPANITKASGKLEIVLDIEKEQAKKLKTMIDNAGVSSFYLGKKGLAYVSRIIV